MRVIQEWRCGNFWALVRAVRMIEIRQMSRSGLSARRQSWLKPFIYFQKPLLRTAAPATILCTYPHPNSISLLQVFPNLMVISKNASLQPWRLFRGDWVMVADPHEVLAINRTLLHRLLIITTENDNLEPTPTPGRGVVAPPLVTR